MNEKIILDFLAKQKQVDILEKLKALPKKDRALLLEDVDKYRKIYQGGVQKEKAFSLSPLKECVKQAQDNYKKMGIESIKKQEVACMVFAGGEGSRLKLSKPKGLLCLDKNNSLISNLCKWVLAYELAFRIKVPLIFLVSSKNKKEIIEHFEKNDFFKLDPQNIFFIEQADYPLFNESHQWFLDHESKIAKAPNGNGDFLEALQRNRSLDILKDKNIKYLQVFFIDNPLIDPLDPSLVGFLKDQELDIAIHVFERDNAEEKVGVICRGKDKHFVIDYMQIDQKVFAKIENKKLLFPYANSGHFCVSIDALISLINKKIELHYHFVWKEINSQTSAWKAEKFAFDIFPYLKCKSLCYEKSETFAPLKTIQDIEKVRNILTKRSSMIYKETYGKELAEKISLTEKDLASYLNRYKVV